MAAERASRSSTFSSADRAAITSRLEADTFDVVVIGGGINGAGVARDAASRGMKVALVEAKDFAIGTSSRSSKLIHGGIRYLENLEFGLVFEALSERRLLFEIAPHLVHPLRFVLPLYKGDRVGMFKMGLGMWLYDALSMFEAPELHDRLSPDEAREKLPLLQTKDLVGAYEYSDAYMDDDRLVIETLRSAVGLGASCINYVSAEDAEIKDGKVVSIGCQDHVSGRKFRVRGRHFISTVGPWTDDVASKLLGEWRKILRPTKGIHLTFDRKRLQLKEAVVMAAGKRIVFGIPRHEMCVIGTTDTDFSGDPYDVSVNENDVKYLLGVAEEYFPGANLTVGDVISSYAGVRPLVDDGSATESKTSREHVIIKDPRNVTFVAGGKYTTYRRMSQETVAAALESFDLESQLRFAKNDTKRPLNPEATASKIDESERRAGEWSREFGMDQDSVEMLISRHGGEAYGILRDHHQLPAVKESEEKLWALEARHAARQTMCMNLVDFYVRRSPLFLAKRDHGASCVSVLSHVFAQELGWSDSKRQTEEAALRAHIQRELGWKLKFGISASSV